MTTVSSNKDKPGRYIVCQTCFGIGTTPIGRAYLNSKTGKVEGMTSVEKCWMCSGDGMIGFCGYAGLAGRIGP